MPDQDVKGYRVPNGQLGAYIRRHGAPVHTKPEGQDFTIVYYPSSKEIENNEEEAKTRRSLRGLVTYEPAVGSVRQGTAVSTTRRAVGQAPVAQNATGSPNDLVRDAEITDLVPEGFEPPRGGGEAEIANRRNRDVASRVAGTREADPRALIEDARDRLDRAERALDQQENKSERLTLEGSNTVSEEEKESQRKAAAKTLSRSDSTVSSPTPGSTKKADETTKTSDPAKTSEAGRETTRSRESVKESIAAKEAAAREGSKSGTKE